MASGAAAGLAMGILLALFIEYRDSTFRRGDDVARVLTLPVLGVVPAFRSSHEKRVRRWRTFALNFGAAVALVGAVSVVVAWRLQLLQL
jgi:hypothetical protein